MSEEISRFLQERINAGDFPSAVYLVAEKGEIVLHEALGHAVVEPELIAAQKDTIYDLASLTKVLVTGLISAKRYEGLEFDLETQLSQLLPNTIGKPLGSANVLELLTHTSKLPAWLPFYLKVETAFDVLDEIVNTELTAAQEVVYSDLNFLVLASIFELHKFGERLSNEMLSDQICRPLGLSLTSFNPLPGLKHRIAASEKGNAFEKQTCVDLGYLSSPASPNEIEKFRTETIWGEVHDNNAYFMGGVAGHAGLFSTAEEVFKIAQQFLPNYTSLLRPETCELFRTNFTPGMNEHRSFAFQLASTTDSTAGMKMSPESFGHLGFTGTSLWIDPVKERVFILLTNRTHNRKLPFENINSVRLRFHDLAIDHLDRIS